MLEDELYELLVPYEGGDMTVALDERFDYYVKWNEAETSCRAMFIGKKDIYGELDVADISEVTEIPLEDFKQYYADEGTIGVI